MRGHPFSKMHMHCFRTIIRYEHIIPAWFAICHFVHRWASYQIRKIAGCACAGNAGNVYPRRRFQRKPLVSNPSMHHGTCVTHVPWCMSGSLTCGDGENVPGIPGACAPAILRIWQQAHAVRVKHLVILISNLYTAQLRVILQYKTSQLTIVIMLGLETLISLVIKSFIWWYRVVVHTFQEHQWSVRCKSHVGKIHFNQ